jgi:hypothetical protein
VQSFIYEELRNYAASFFNPATDLCVEPIRRSVFPGEIRDEYYLLLSRQCDGVCFSRNLVAA